MRVLSFIAVIAALCLPASGAIAQGKGASKASSAPGQTKKAVSAGDAVDASREIFGKHGYQFVRVETVGATRVIYYRRCNMGKGKGLGPIEKMVVRPSNNIVVFEGGPSGVVVDLRVRLGL